MGDPELRSDEKVLVRTPGVYVKSIPFEGILTNKRIILVDRAKNLLPPKEIPLVTIKEIETGENAIMDKIITLSVMAKTGETRQMILTFSRQAGGNRAKERDTWARIIRENASSSFDQVIRKVIPKPEPAPQKTEPAGRKYEVIHSPLPQQPQVPPVPDRSSVIVADEMKPVRRTVSAAPAAPIPPFPPVQPVPPATPQPEVQTAVSETVCPKCGSRIPAGSVFCNRCGSPVAPITPAAIPEPSPAPIPAAPPVVRPPAARPLDDEIQSIEPLIERSSARVPPDALRSPHSERYPAQKSPEPVPAAPSESPLRQPLTWEDEEATEQVASPAEPAAGANETTKGFLPRLFRAKSSYAGTPAPVPAHDTPMDIPHPPKPPKGRSILPGKKTIITGALAILVIVIIAAGALFVYPMLSSTSPVIPSVSGGDTTPGPTITSATLSPQNTPKVRETKSASVPSTGVYVHVNYLGGFKGNYGMPDMAVTIPGNSGDRVWEVELANGTVEASFEKLDGSSHELLVEIYKDGKSLTSGTTTVGHGSVTLSVNLTTGIAAAPITSGSSSSAKTGSVAAVATTAAMVTSSVVTGAATSAAPP